MAPTTFARWVSARAADNGGLMSRVTDLRRMADLCKRMASIRTSGGHEANRRLLVLADSLGREAARLEAAENRGHDPQIAAWAG
jgi:hypothetical protein